MNRAVDSRSIKTILLAFAAGGQVNRHAGGHVNRHAGGQVNNNAST